MCDVMNLKSILVKIWHTLPFEPRVRFANNLRQLLRPINAKLIGYRKAQQPKKSGGVTIIGFHSASIGHGIATRLLAQEFRNSGVEVRNIDVSDIQNAPRDYNSNLLFQMPKDGDVLIFVVNPDLLVDTIRSLPKNLIKNHYLVGYWVWELEIAPKSWKIAKDLVHEIWSPSEFSAKALSDLFAKPVKSLSHPAALLDAIIPTLSREQWRAENAIAQDAFVAFQSFSISSSLERKNVFGAIEAFEMAFTKADNAYLVLRYSGDKNFPNALIRLKNRIARSNANILLIKSKQDIKDVFEAYSASDCYISLHRAEGFGLNLAEAMLFGLPLICTKWSGNMDFMTEDTCALVDCGFIEVSDPDGIYEMKGAKWAIPGTKMAANFLKKMQNDIEWRNYLIKNAKEYAKEKLSGQNLKEWI